LESKQTGEKTEKSKKKAVSFVGWDYTIVEWRVGKVFCHRKIHNVPYRATRKNFLASRENQLIHLGFSKEEGGKTDINLSKQTKKGGRGRKRK